MSCSDDRTICLWNPNRDDMKDGYLIKTYKGPHGYGVTDIAMYLFESSLNPNSLVLPITQPLDPVDRKRKVSFGMFPKPKSPDDYSVTRKYLRSLPLLRAIENQHDHIQRGDDAGHHRHENCPRCEILLGSYDTTVRLYDLRYLPLPSSHPLELRETRASKSSPTPKTPSPVSFSRTTFWFQGILHWKEPAP